MHQWLWTLFLFFLKLILCYSRYYPRRRCLSLWNCIFDLSPAFLSSLQVMFRRRYHIPHPYPWCLCGLPAKRRNLWFHHHTLQDKLHLNYSLAVLAHHWLESHPCHPIRRRSLIHHLLWRVFLSQCLVLYFLFIKKLNFFTFFSTLFS